MGGGDKDGYGMLISDNKEVQRIGLGFRDGNAGIMLYDDKGQYVRGMVRQKDGLELLLLYRQDGKEVFQIEGNIFAINGENDRRIEQV